MTAIDFPNSPTTNQTFTAGGVTWRHDGSKWGLDGYASGPTYETALPGSPVDGQEIYYAADATNGIIWHLRYRSAARSGSGAWEFLGGASLTSEVTTNQTRSNAAYGDLTTTGPSIALPLKGDYTVRIAALMYVTSATSAQVDAFMSYQIGSTGASNNDAAIVGAWVFLLFFTFPVLFRLFQSFLF